jgi:hypothetical protein
MLIVTFVFLSLSKKISQNKSFSFIELELEPKKQRLK